MQKRKSVSYWKSWASRKGFPLTANGNRCWSKKIHGKVYYFGPLEKHREALVRLKEEGPRIESGLPRFVDMNATIEELVDAFVAMN